MVLQRSVYDYIFKLIVIGNTATGKSSLLSRYVEHKFDDQMTHTIGVEFGSSLISIDGKTIKLQIWDTAGQERFAAVTRSYYRSAVGCILVYDVTRRETFNQISVWLQEARTLADPECVMCLVGNKTDISARAVSTEEGHKFAQENGLIFVETSAKLNTNVEDLFVNTAQAIYEQVKVGKLQGHSSPASQPQPSSGDSCSC
ncbi:hypothetical protein GEMRC1_001544 [Eukaryota sp. GEM-RC1]